MFKPTHQQIRGCLYGLALGDALGAPYEGGFLERLLWQAIGKTADKKPRWTDDTQMTLDLLESILETGGIHPEHLAQRFAASYRWRRGYGPGTAKILKRIRAGTPFAQAAKAVYPNGSYGNGAAMRSAVLALIYPDVDELMAAVRSTAAITHAHPLGIEGALLIALAARALLRQQSSGEIVESLLSVIRQPPLQARLETVAAWLATENAPAPRQVVATLGNGMTAQASCPTALYLALRHRSQPFLTLMDFVIQCGGDVDTIGSMAGALWGIANGDQHLPPMEIEDCDRLQRLADALQRRYGAD